MLALHGAAQATAAQKMTNNFCQCGKPAKFQARGGGGREIRWVKLTCRECAEKEENVEVYPIANDHH
jgi:hypothetical protein